VASNPIITAEEHGPLIDAALKDAQQILDDCLRGERCKIDVRRQKSDIEDTLNWLMTFKQEYLSGETH
jgi:hypothetical protein